MRLNRIAFFTTLLSILCLGASFKVWADDEIETYGMPESHDFIQHRTYIGIFGTSADIDNNNDFSGYEEFITAPATTGTSFPNQELDFIPTINRNFGFAGMVGHREGPWALEFSYWYSNHTASVYTGGPTTFTTSSVFTSINFDLKRYFFTTLPIQPFIDFGVNFTSLTSHNTSEVFAYDSTTTSYDIYQGTGDQTDSGYGINLGVGGELYLGDGFSLVAGVIERFTTWQSIQGLEKTPYIPTFSNNYPTNPDGGLAGNGTNFYVGMTVGFDQ
jgi:hypothetical protein